MRRLHASVAWNDLPHLAEQARLLVAAGADALHIDIEPSPHLLNRTRAPALVHTLHHQARRADGARAAVEVHLLGEAEGVADACAEAGADAVVLHAESARQAVPTFRSLRRAGCRAGLALHPGASLDTLAGSLGSIDQVLVLLAAPGAPAPAGALPRALTRVELVRRLVDLAGGGIRVQAEGVIGVADVAALLNAGADDIVLAAMAADAAPEEATTLPLIDAVQALRRAFDPPALPSARSGLFRFAPAA